MGNAVTQHTITPLSSATQLVANVSILPPGSLGNAKLAAELLYASNLNLTLDSTNIGAGDTILVLATTPVLKPVRYVTMGLAQVRAMALLGDNDQFLLAAGLVGGRVKVFERVSEEQGWLKQVASLNDTRIVQPTSFVSV